MAANTDVPLVFDDCCAGFSPRLTTCESMNILTFLEKQSLSPFLSVLLGFVLIGLIGFCDFLTGYELAFSVFYVLPIASITWLTNRRLGILASFASASIWFAADTGTGHFYSHPLIPVWNAFIRFAFFVIITWLLSALKKAMEHEKKLARIDYLTGAVNSRTFYDLARMEIGRFQRYKHPFSIAYIDLDNFKAVNDRFGHLVGDQVLRAVVSSARSHLRSMDVVARLGGDEFALLLPETNVESVRVALTKIHGGLSEAMRRGNWPITFSIGVMTCRAAPDSVEQLIKLTDQLMYSVKHERKNAIKFSTYDG
ncbi:MAG: GGDEF domain-containing protein [Gammaproteobacteria bacterium]